MLMYIEIILWLTFAFILYLLIRHKSKKSIDFPTPPTIPFFGNTLELGSSKTLLNVFKKYGDEFGGIVNIKLGPFRNELLITDYKLIEFLLASNKILNKSPDYVYLKNWLGTGLLTSRATKWRKHRKMITPAFHFKILEKFVDTFESNGKILVENIKNSGDNLNSIDIYPFITLCTLDIICETSMGISVYAQRDKTNSKYFQSIRKMLQVHMKRLFTLLKMYDFTFEFTEDRKIQKQSLEYLHETTNRVIDQKIDQLKNISPVNSDKKQDDFGIKEKPAFLDLLLQATVDGKSLTRTEIREEVDTFMFEGHDTTSSGIAFTLYCLANYPECQEKALREQYEIFGNINNPTVTYSNLQEMKYLDMFIKETMRLYPPVPFFARMHDEDFEFDGKLIPKGTYLSIFAYGIHRNPKYFPDPEKFDPSRFEGMDGKTPFAYIPFSAGARNCIGQKFAMLEMKSTVSKMLRNFELFPSNPKHNLELVWEAILKSDNGIKIGLKLRNNK